MRSDCQSQPEDVKGLNWDYSGRKLELKFNRVTVSTVNLHLYHFSIFLS